MVKTIITMFPMLMLLAFPLNKAGAEVRNFNQTFNVAPGGRLIINNDFGL